MYIYLPNVAAAGGRVQLAALSSLNGLVLVSNLAFFPDKYTKLVLILFYILLLMNILIHKMTAI